MSHLGRRKLRSTIIFILAVFASVLFVGFLFRLGPAPQPEAMLVQIGGFPDNHIWFNTNQPLDIHDQLKRHIVVVFFCDLSLLADIRAVSYLNDIFSEFSEQPLAVIIALQTDKTDIAEIRKIVEAWGIDFPVIVDDRGMVADLFNVGVSPAVVVLDVHARVSARFFVGWQHADLGGIVADLFHQARAMRLIASSRFKPDSGMYIPDSQLFEP